jgi:ribosomal protein L19E
MKADRIDQGWRLADVDRLLGDGLIEETPVEGQSWSRYRATDRGIAHGRRLLAKASQRHAEAVEHLFELKQAVASRTFAALLEDVYDRYPDYAAKSIFRRRS